MKILFSFRLSTGISKIQRGLYRQPYTTVHTVREQNGGSQSLLYRSPYSFIFPSFLSLVFLVFVFRRHSMTYTFFVHAQRAKSGLHADVCKSSIDTETTLFCSCVNADLFILLIFSLIHNK